MLGITILAACGDATQGQAAGPDPLFVLVGELTTKAVAEENQSSVIETTERGEDSSDAYRFKADEIRVDRGDFDTDGDDDAVVTIYTCEASNCHSSTRATRIAHLVSAGGGFRVGNNKRYTLRAEITDLWGVNGIEIKATDYGPNDPSCCPTRVTTSTIPVKRSN